LKKPLPENKPELTVVKILLLGVNKYRLEKEDPLHILDVDNQMVRKQQIEQFKQIKATRNNEKVKELFSKINRSG
jgi:methylmalonyl-CoA mutase